MLGQSVGIDIQDLVTIAAIQKYTCRVTWDSD